MKYCQEITEMLERSSVEKLSFMNTMNVKFHLIICKACKMYSKDSIAMDQLLTKRFKKIDQYSFTKLEKENLKQKL